MLKASITDDSVITCEEIVDAVDKSYGDTKKTVSTNFNEKKVSLKTKKFYFTHLYINYHSIIDSC